MLARFSLYGFLKNQQYYDPFIVLAFLQMGLNYTLIGVVIAFREVMVNIMEIPTGGIADLFGRRRSMIFSHCAYIVSFSGLGAIGLAAMRTAVPVAVLMPLILAAMVFYAIGDAFRTGTHKAIIFGWLRKQGRTNERTRVYGFTRSWSKIGSAVSVILASIFVFITKNYIYVFFFSIIPYILNIINFAGYPADPRNDSGTRLSMSNVFQHLFQTVRTCIRQASLRRLMLESMGFEGFFKAAKDYLQPILQAAALPLTAVLFDGVSFDKQQRSVFLIGPVYFVLFLLSAAASRNAHRFVRKGGEEERTARLLWGLILLVLLGLVPSTAFGIHWAMILGFVLLYILQNIWRPVLISRFDAYSDEKSGATVLSVESQAKSTATMVIAPVLGFAVDTVKRQGIGGSEFWPVAIFGAVVALGFFLTSRIPDTRQ
jgi:MFS family permease